MIVRRRKTANACPASLGATSCQRATLFSSVMGALVGAVGALVLGSWRDRPELADPVVEQLSFPLVIPIDDAAGHVASAGETHPAVPQMAGGSLIVPLENAGLGPAINVQATVAVASRVAADRLEAAIGVIASGRCAALRFAVDGPLRDFDVRLTYQDYRGRPHRLNASWKLDERSYAIDW